MILDHVAQLPGLVEIAPAPFDPHLLGHGDFHVGDMVLVPLGLEQAVGEAQGDQVLHRLLAQVMVDAVDAVLGEHPGHRIVDRARGRQVVTDGLLQHHPRALGQADSRQVAADAAIDGGRRGEVGDQLILRADVFEQRRVVLGLEKIHAQVVQPRQETREIDVRQFLGRHMQAQRLLDGAQVAVRGPGLAGQRQDARAIVQQTGTIELVKRGKQLAQGEITQGTEQGEGTGFKLDCGHEIVLLSRCVRNTG